jgi:hypothetical protein
MTNSSSRSDALPAPLVQIQEPPGLGLEVRIARKDPARCAKGESRPMQPTQTVLSLMRATRPERCACRATSATLSRESGKPKVPASRTRAP